MTAWQEAHDVIGRLKAAREARGLSMQDVSDAITRDERMTVSRDALQSYEIGRAWPPLPKLIAWCRVLGEAIVVKGLV